MSQGARTQLVQGSRVRRAQRSKHPQERLQGSRVKHSPEGAGLRALPTWPQEPREKPSGPAKDNKDGKAGEGPW